MFLRRTQIALMDRHACIVISDATSVQPLCRSRVDLRIIGLVAEAVEAEVAVRGVEEALRNLWTASRALLCCDGSFYRWSSPGEP